MSFLEDLRAISDAVLELLKLTKPKDAPKPDLSGLKPPPPLPPRKESDGTGI